MQKHNHLHRWYFLNTRSEEVEKNSNHIKYTVQFLGTGGISKLHSYKKIDYIYNLGNFFDSDLFCCEIFDKITSDTRFLNIVGRNEQKLLDMAYGLWMYGEEISNACF